MADDPVDGQTTSAGPPSNIQNVQRSMPVSSPQLVVGAWFTTKRLMVPAKTSLSEELRQIPRNLAAQV